jgi:hypothetical protein
MSGNEIILRNGSKFVFYSKSAEVMTDPSVWSETRISSSGGGGYVHPTQGGHVSAPQVHSTVTERQKYFIQTDDGKELEMKDAVAARKGHSIRLVYGGVLNDTSYLLATENSVLSKHRLNSPRYYNKYFGMWSSIQGRGFGNVRGASMVGVSLVAIIAAHFMAIILIPGGCLVMGQVERRKRIKELDAALILFINGLP